MDISDIAKKLGLDNNKLLIRKAAEIRRLCDAQFDSSIIGVGEICKAVICMEIAATRLQILFDRQAAIKLSGMSEKAYSRSFNSLQNVIGIKIKLNVRELAVQFGCVRIIKSVQNVLTSYKERFLASLPASRRANADFTRPVFTAAAFYLCAKKQKLKVDKLRLIEVCGTSESEFSCVSTSMTDLCFDCVGISKEKKDAKDVKGNRDLLDVLPGKRRLEDGGYSSDEDVYSWQLASFLHHVTKDIRRWKRPSMRTGNLQSSIRSSRIQRKDLRELFRPVSISQRRQRQKSCLLIHSLAHIRTRILSNLLLF
ncbi:PREDICTED: origin of replication complex subunit 6 isoform X1 [Camelina sativa]|uniref:Origin of replication complex subunit 6 isoform X1 n=2 Tax=Camelina sativa TaxID=90675 RepID=A0ABM0VRY4_CAMSA|nr:PREDICTED: origin of replication complex subunit 6 isoform X1 [Camelina sativa]